MNEKNMPNLEDLKGSDAVWAFILLAFLFSKEKPEDFNQ